MTKADHKTKLCTQCYECVKHCTGGALKYHEGIMIYSEKNCTLCEVCMDICDNGAIQIKEG